MLGAGTDKVVFIHGILGFYKNFYNLAKNLSSYHQVLLYDQRGHGKSKHKSAYTLLHFVQDLKQLLEKLQWQSVTLIGHSFGGYVAYLFAKLYPQSVTKMLIIDSSPWPLESNRDKIKKLLRDLPWSFESRLKAKMFFQESVKNKNFSQTLANFLIANLEPRLQGPIKFLFDRNGIINLLNSMRDNPEIATIIKQIQVPALILRGDKSQHYSQSDFKKTLQSNSLFTGKQIQNCGHWIHFEQQQVFKNILKEFLS